MAGVTTTTTLNDDLNVMVAEFKILRDATGVIRDTSTQLKLNPREGLSKNILNYQRVTAYDVADGVDIAQAQQLSDTLSSYTPSERAVQVVIGGRTMRRVADPDLQGRAAKICNNAYDLKEDQDGILALASFTGSSTLGAAGTVLSPGHVAAAYARLSYGDNRTNPEPAPMPYYGVIHPNSALPLWGRLIPLASTPQGATAYGVNTGAHGGVSIANGADSDYSGLLKSGPGDLGIVAGCMIKQDANFNPDANDDYTCAFYSKEGLIYVGEESVNVDVDVSDKSMRGAAEINVWGSFVFGVYRGANYGIPSVWDASIPTS